MTDICSEDIHPIAPRAPRRFSILNMLLSMHELARQRRALGDLEPHQLHDVGITSSAAKEEANRPVWDAPAHWR